MCIVCLAKANGSNCVLRKYTVTVVCRIVIAVCALIKTMICFSSERSRSANVGLLLGQCNRRQDNIKYTLWSAWRFCQWWQRTQSCWCHHRMWWCSRSSTGNMFGAVYNQSICVSHDGESKSVCRVWQPTDRQGRPIVTCVGVSFDAWLWSQLTICVPMWIIIIWTICIKRHI